MPDMTTANISPGTIITCAVIASTMGARCALWIGKIRQRSAFRRQEKRQRIKALCMGATRSTPRQRKETTCHAINRL